MGIPMLQCNRQGISCGICFGLMRTRGVDVRSLGQLSGSHGTDPCDRVFVAEPFFRVQVV
jgi:hypothetical protein